jgi:hypothetical protein
MRLILLLIQTINLESRPNENIEPGYARRSVTGDFAIGATPPARRHDAAHMC